jgi:hypothetical protein
MAKYIVHNGIRIASEFVPETFGRLTTLGPRFRVGLRTYQACTCSCGSTSIVLMDSLRREQGTRSCGCLRKEKPLGMNIIHGKTNTPEHSIWASIKGRCNNPNDKGYKRYGGRGIRVCDRWLEPNGQGFLNFLADMGPRPGPKYSIDRKDNDKDYCPENCRWATDKEQARNRRSNRILEAFDRAQCLAAWAEEFNMDRGVLWDRINYGWDIEKALLTPIKQKNNAKKNT